MAPDLQHRSETETATDRLKEEVFGATRDLIERAEEVVGSWPQIDEPFYEENEADDSHRIVIRTMSGAIAAVTTYAVTAGDGFLLKAILVIAAAPMIVHLIRSTQRRPSKRGKQREQANQRRPQGEGPE